MTKLNTLLPNVCFLGYSSPVTLTDLFCWIMYSKVKHPTVPNVSVHFLGYSSPVAFTDPFCWIMYDKVKYPTVPDVSVRFLGYSSPVELWCLAPSLAVGLCIAARLNTPPFQMFLSISLVTAPLSCSQIHSAGPCIAVTPHPPPPATPPIPSVSWLKFPCHTQIHSVGSHLVKLNTPLASVSWLKFPVTLTELFWWVFILLPPVLSVCFLGYKPSALDHLQQGYSPLHLNVCFLGYKPSALDHLQQGYSPLHPSVCFLGYKPSALITYSKAIHSPPQCLFPWLQALCLGSLTARLFTPPPQCLFPWLQALCLGLLTARLFTPPPQCLFPWLQALCLGSLTARLFTSHPNVCFLGYKPSALITYSKAIHSPPQCLFPWLQAAAAEPLCLISFRARVGPDIMALQIVHFTY